MNGLMAEKQITYLAIQPGLAAGTYFNGVAAASTSVAAMAVGLGSDGKAIKISNARRALITVSLGVLGTGLLGTITAHVTSSTEKADGASLYQIPVFTLSYDDTSDGKILKGEIDLRGVTPPSPVAGDPGLNLWIKHVGTGVNVSVQVQLGDFNYEPTAEVLDIKAPATLSM